MPLIYLGCLPYVVGMSLVGSRYFLCMPLIVCDCSACCPYVFALRYVFGMPSIRILDVFCMLLYAICMPPKCLGYGVYPIHGVCLWYAFYIKHSFCTSSVCLPYVFHMSVCLPYVRMSSVCPPLWPLLRSSDMGCFPLFSRSSVSLEMGKSRWSWGGILGREC